MPEVKIYSTPTCPYCVKAKAYFKEKGIIFQNVDVSSDESGLKEMIDLSGQMGVPVVVINGKVTVGFDKSSIDAQLGSV